MKYLFYIITVGAVCIFGKIGMAQDVPSPGAPQAKQAQEELDRAHREFDQAQKELERSAQNFPHLNNPQPAPGTAFSDRLQSIITKASSPTMGGPARPLVIRSSDMDPKEQAGLEEDLVIMARILDKAVEQIPGPMPPYFAMGINVFSPGSKQMQNFYLEGYGAVFMVRVGFPLLSPPPPQAEQSKGESEADSAWEQARQEIYGQGNMAMPAPMEEFSETKVNETRTRLLEALKSATNIRALKPEDLVTVCVFGGATAGGRRVAARATARASAGGGMTPPRSVWVTTDSSNGQHGTIMTLRAKKADIDAFAKGRVNAEQFRTHVRIETYASGPAGDGATVFGKSGGGGLSGENRF